MSVLFWTGMYFCAPSSEIKGFVAYDPLRDAICNKHFDATYEDFLVCAYGAVSTAREKTHQ